MMRTLSTWIFKKCGKIEKINNVIVIIMFKYRKNRIYNIVYQNFTEYNC